MTDITTYKDGNSTIHEAQGESGAEIKVSIDEAGACEISIDDYMVGFDIRDIRHIMNCLASAEIDLHRG